MSYPTPPGVILTEGGTTFWRILDEPPPTEDTYYITIHWFYEQYLRKVEIRFRLNLDAQTARTDFVITFETAREDISQISLTLKIDSGNNIFILYDNTSNSSVTTPYSNQWLKLIVTYKDSEGGEAKLVDDYGNTLASIQLSPGTGNGTFQHFVFQSLYLSTFKSILDINYITMEYDNKPPMFDPSGLDPNDPTWAPPDGWTEIYNFDAWLDSYTAFNNYHLGGNGNGLIVFGSDKNDYSSAVTDRYGKFYRKIALAIKFIRVNFTTTDTYISELYSDKANTNGVWFNLYTVANERKIKLVDNNNPDQPMIIPIPDDWFVFVVEVLDSGGVVKIYDKNKTLIGQYNIAPDIWIYDYFYFKIDSRNQYQTSDVWSFVIDWIALKE